MEPAKYRIESLRKDHEKKHFSCGIAALDRYIKEQAGQDECRHIAAIYVLTAMHSNAMMGYYTLSASSIELAALPDSFKKKLPRYPSLPTILLGRLAIDKGCQGKNLGAYLLIDALKRSAQVSRQLGSIAVIVQAKNDQAIQFYQHYGFSPFLDAPDKLFLPMATIEQLEKK